MGQMNLSARGYHRVLKLARTIADLAGCEQIQAPHLAVRTVCLAEAHYLWQAEDYVKQSALGFQPHIITVEWSYDKENRQFVGT